ncbi:MAG: tetratricopeptide repeat protein [Chitinophagales bacterium]
MKKTLLVLLTFTIACSTFAQSNLQWRKVNSNETTYLDAFIPGVPMHERTYVRIFLPKGTVGFVYRISVGDPLPKTGLIDSLKTQSIPDLKGSMELTNIIKPSGGSVNVYLFGDQKQAMRFEDYETDSLSVLRVFYGASKMCRYEGRCNNMTSLGFDNVSLKSVEVHWDVVALVDTAKEAKLSNYYYTSVYKNCIESKSLAAETGAKHEEYCKCLANECANNPTFGPGTNAEVNQERGEYFQEQCLLKTKVYTYDELQKKKITVEVNRLAAANKNDSIVAYCENRIRTGREYSLVYNTLGWYLILVKKFNKANYYLETAHAKYPDDLFIAGNYAHALLLSGDADKAKELYRLNKGKMLNEKLSWNEMVKNDFEEFKAAGIQSPYFDEVLALLKK